MKIALQRIGDSLGRLTLSNPPGNAMDRPDFLPIAELASFLQADDLKGLIVCGQGRHFSAGADLSALSMQQTGSDFGESVARGKQILQMINRASVPVIALVRGSCLGAGLELALACHFRFASPTALLGFPEAQHGLIPGLGGTVMAPELLGLGGAIDLILSGRCILADEALQRGLVDRVCPPADLEQLAITYLRELTARHSPRLIHHAMASIHDGRFLARDEALRQESRRFFELIQDASLDE